MDYFVGNAVLKSIFQMMHQLIQSNPFIYDVIAMPKLELLDRTSCKYKKRLEQLQHLSLALKTGREETMNGMGLHRIEFFRQQ